MFSLNNRLVIVTGASSGIGRQCAISCSHMGAIVVLLGRDKERLNETLGEMKTPKIHTVCAIDLLDYEGIDYMINKVVKEKGRLSGLINCAGISTTSPLNAVTPQLMEHFFKTNVIGAVNLTRQVVKSSHFSKEGGSIIFINSVMGVVGEKGKTLYSMTKGALVPVSKSMSIELASRKIRVNCISPGVVETPMSSNAIYSRNKGSLEKVKQLHPLGLGTPEDVANSCIFLLSDSARWITGSNLIVDGGYLAK